MNNKTRNIAIQNTRNQRGLSLANYVHRRNGVPLGASGSLQNMLYRSFSAGSFAKFRYVSSILKQLGKKD